jgi:hypothetical protein
MLSSGQAVDSALLHADPPFKAPSGGGLGKPPASSVKKGRVIWLCLFYSTFQEN